jgi:hypothetical protein
VNADCCPGETCDIANGATSGVCGPCNPTTTTTTTGAGSTTSTGTGGGCALYGQQCTTGADCCNAVPCENASNNTCGVGDTGCTCHASPG